MKEGLDIVHLHFWSDDLDRKIRAVPLTQLAVDALTEARRDRVADLVFCQDILRTPGHAQAAGFAEFLVDSDLEDPTANLGHVL